MNELKTLEVWLIDRMDNYAERAEVYRSGNFKNMLMVCNAKRGEAYAILQMVRAMIRECKK